MTLDTPATIYDTVNPIRWFTKENTFKDITESLEITFNTTSFPFINIIQIRISPRPVQNIPESFILTGAFFFTFYFFYIKKI